MKGRYSNSSGVSSCWPCPAGTYLPTPAQSSRSSCIDCPHTVHCPAGSSSASSTCKRVASLDAFTCLAWQVPWVFTWKVPMWAVHRVLAAFFAHHPTKQHVHPVTSVPRSALHQYLVHPAPSTAIQEVNHR